jgi:hypothetical protein
MKLTTENIQFIDNYLKNSEVIYYDIRMEMLDHVATAVEQKMAAENLDFYDAFKSYMVVNKKGLMQQNEKTKRFNFGFSQSKRFYAIEKNGVILFVVYYPFQFLLSGIITGDKDISIISGLIVTFFLSWFLVFVFYNRDEIRKIKNLKNQLQR